MADLSVARRAALAQIIEQVPDARLPILASAVEGLPGAAAQAFALAVAEEVKDRRRRALAFAPILPMFAPRRDGVEAMTFPPAVLPRLWVAARTREAGMAPLLDERGEDGPSANAMLVAGRLCIAAAAAVRDQPDIVWPVTLGDVETRAAGLEALARAFDLGPLIHRSLRSLPAWIGRPSGDELAELRLLVRDCSTVAPDGATRLFAILFAHLSDASLIIRLVSHATNATGRETFVAGSELAVFVDRLVVAVEAISARTAEARRQRTVVGAAALGRDLHWCADVLFELDSILRPSPESVWGSARAVRVQISETLSALLGEVSRAVDPVLPLARLQTAGRMSRLAPKLDAPVEPAAVALAMARLDLLSAARASAAAFGCESQRRTLVETLGQRLTEYAEQALDLLNGGDAPDERLALARIETVAGLLDHLGAGDEARIVRRRAAVAGPGAVVYAA